MAGIVGSNPNMAIPWYLMASYAYYELDRPILSDAAFDKLGKAMLKMWDSLEHKHKHLITEDDLKAGSLMTREFPETTVGAAKRLIKDHGI